MEIRGWQKVSLIDYPGEICSTLFVGGCNFRCGYCYNRDLVVDYHGLPLFSTEEIFGYLRSRASLVEGVCLTGGEPTLQEDLVDFVLLLKKSGFKVKLDTNGARPDVLRKLLKDNLLDFIAVDIKAPPEKYPIVTGVNIEWERIKETVQLLQNSPVKQEFRTTVVPGLLEVEDLLNIARSIRGSSRYVLQQFHPASTLINPCLGTAKPFSREDILKASRLCGEYVEKVEIRGF